MRHPVSSHGDSSDRSALAAVPAAWRPQLANRRPAARAGALVISWGSLLAGNPLRWVFALALVLLLVGFGLLYLVMDARRARAR